METASLRHSSPDASKAIVSGGWFDLHSLLDRFALHVGTIARSTGKLIEVTISEQTPRYFSGDYLRVTDVLNNVASYALSHLDEGIILFTVNAHPIRQCQYRVDIVVVTSGTGIPYHKFDAVFLPDHRPGEPGYSNSSLYVAKTIATLMGGDLIVENTAGWGTRYLIHLLMESEVPDYTALRNHCCRPRGAIDKASGIKEIS